jgi:hypothetical protein
MDDGIPEYAILIVTHTNCPTCMYPEKELSGIHIIIFITISLSI